VAPSTPAASSPEALDAVIHTTRPRAWWALTAIAVALAAVIVWSVTATVPQQVSVRGVVAAGDLLRVVPASASGSVIYNVQSGDTVTAGFVVATIQPFPTADTSNAPVGIDLTAPVAGTVQTIFLSQGSGVEQGAEVLSLLQPLTQASGVLVKTFVPANIAVRFTVGETAQVLITNVETGQSESAAATIEAIDDVPSTLAGITTATGSSEIAQQFASSSAGVPYRVVLRITDDIATTQQTALQPGELLEIIHTYANPRPIEILFGGR
jgi:multidrug efflux pump subunit AcrA (membrane-fusion protein)